MTKYELTGSCLCGAVAYSTAVEVKDFYFCHCEQCRKVTGSAFAANILARPAEVCWLKGAERVRRFDYPGDRSFTTTFCTVCGSPLPFLNKSGTTLFIPAGTLDGDPGVAVGHNIFWKEHAAWFEQGLAAPRSAGFAE